MSSPVISPLNNSIRTQAPPGWYLLGCIVPGRELVEINLHLPSLKIGRREEMDLVLPSLRVSGCHAELIFVGETLFIRDLGSTNGTFVNRNRVLQPMPIEDGDHLEIADIEFLVQYRQPQPVEPHKNLSELKKTVQDFNSIREDWMLSQFSDFILKRQVTPYYQSIVELRNLEVRGYESLARSHVPGLENPGKMFQAAEMVNQEVPLSVICREKAVEVACQLGLLAPVFLNTHPHENFNRDVLPSIVALKHIYPEVGLVIEFHEKTIESASAMLEHKALLDEMDVKIAYDDFGAGRSRMLELVKAPPDYLKFDRCLIQDIHLANTQQLKMIQSLIVAAQDAGITTLAEGIELAEEAVTCRDLGFELGQGYYFSRPQPDPRS